MKNQFLLASLVFFSNLITLNAGAAPFILDCKYHLSSTFIDGEIKIDEGGRGVKF